MNSNKMVKTAHIVIFKDGKVLGVSRKDDHKDFGLPGGKMEDTDMGNPEFTAIRECKEETGIDVFSLELIFAIHKNGHMGYTYLAEYVSDEIKHDEPHVVDWVPFETLVKGKFGKYNELVAESLRDMGVKFQYDIDYTPLEKEIEEFVNSTPYEGIKMQFKNLQKTTNWLGTSVMEVNFCGYWEEMLGFDDTYRVKFDEFSKKWRVIVSLNSDYYSK